MQRDLNQFDFFVSYARKDNETGWITRFIEELLAEHRRFVGGDPDRALKPFFDKQSIRAFDDFQSRILNDGLARSRLFIAFVSPSFFASEWCRREWRAWIDTEIAKHILSAGAAPIYLVEVPGFVAKVPGLTEQRALPEQEVAAKVAELCGVPPPHQSFIAAASPSVHQLRTRRQITADFVKPFQDEGIAALRREDLRKVLGRLAEDLEQRVQEVRRGAASENTVPPYNKKFTGRLDELLELRGRLKDDRAGVITGIHGLGGIGKTELAFTYAHAFASAYPGGRFLISCEGKSNLRDAVLTQNDLIGLFGNQISDEERKQPGAHFAAVLRCLRDRLNNLGHVLLVLDNVVDAGIVSRQQTDTLTALGPKLHLLATTRLPAPGGAANWLSLGQLPDADALALLDKHRPFTSETEREAARRIVKRLGGFTLAVELVAAHLAEHPDVTCIQMADIIGLQDLEVIAGRDDSAVCRHNHERRLSAVLNPTLAALTPAESRTMEYAALLPPDHIPLPWLRTLVAADFPQFDQPARLTNPWGDLWRRLEKLALFSRPEEATTEPRLMRDHRLVQELVMERNLTKADRAVRQQAIRALAEQRIAVLGKTQRWQDARWELEALDALAWHWARTDDAEAGWLLCEIGVLWVDVAGWDRAEAAYRKAITVQERTLGRYASEVGIDLNNLGKLLVWTDRMEEAQRCYRRALVIFKKVHGRNHTQVAIGRSNLGQLYRNMGLNAKAEAFIRRAVQVFEKEWGPQDPRTAPALNNLADVLSDTRKYEEAEQLYRRVLAIARSHYPKHPDHASTLNNLAHVILATGRLTEAEGMYRESLSMMGECYGESHPEVAVVLGGLGNCLRQAGRLTEAEQPYRRALEIREQSLPPLHSQVALSNMTLAQLLLAANRLAEAEPLMRRALAIYEKSRGPDHPDTLNCNTSLAILLEHKKDYMAAEPLQRHLLKTQQRTLGSEHPDTISTLISLATTLHLQGKSLAAGRLLRLALHTAERVLGPEHPLTLHAVQSQGVWLQDKGNLAAAELLFQRASQMRERVLGPEHPDTLISCDSMATVLESRGNREAAERLFQRVLTAKERVLGPRHSDTLRTVSHLARVLGAKGDCVDAEPLYRRALENAPNNIILLGNLAFFLQNTRCDLHGARDFYERALAADPKDQINHTNYAGLCLVMGAAQEAEEHLRAAWRLMAGKADRYTARILFLRAALAALSREDPSLFLGQLRTLFGQGIQPQPSRNVSVRDCLQQQLVAEQFTMFLAIYAAINEPNGLACLNSLPAWQAIRPIALDTPWP